MGYFLFIEPFYGGSHKYFTDGLVKYSSHTIDLITLPDRFWKWRMRGSALYFAEKIKNPEIYDGIITTNMLSLTDLKVLWSYISAPFILYFHENQILYPFAEGEKEDLHYGFTDITNSLSADYIYFNSHYHKSAYLKSLKPFLSRFPDKNPYWVIDKIIAKSHVLYPGCHLSKNQNPKLSKQNPPLIVWNHRWEHDKNPYDFFSALMELDNEGIDFKLVVLGEQYKKSPLIFNEIKTTLKKKIVHFGFVKNYNEYQQWLEKADIILSTANQENFGISVVEAIGSGCFPLLPDRLSYRELISEKYHNLCIYKNQNDLLKKMKKLIAYYDVTIVNNLMKDNLRFSWQNVIKDYDREFAQIIKKTLP